jgi:hypothetical protein
MSRMASSGMLSRVALVRTDVSEEPTASFIRMTRIGELGTTQAATSNRRTLRRNVGCLLQLVLFLFTYSCHPDEGGASSSETSVLTRATRRNIPENTILHSHRRENLRSYLEISLSHEMDITEISIGWRFLSFDLFVNLCLSLHMVG